MPPLRSCGTSNFGQEVDSEAFQTHYLGAGTVCSEVGSQYTGVCILRAVCICILGFIFHFGLVRVLAGWHSLAV